MKTFFKLVIFIYFVFVISSCTSFKYQRCSAENEKLKMELDSVIYVLKTLQNEIEYNLKYSEKVYNEAKIKTEEVLEKAQKERLIKDSLKLQLDSIGNH